MHLRCRHNYTQDAYLAMPRVTIDSGPPLKHKTKHYVCLEEGREKSEAKRKGRVK